MDVCFLVKTALTFWLITKKNKVLLSVSLRKKKDEGICKYVIDI